MPDDKSATSPSREAVLAEVDRVVRSARFGGVERQARLLRFLVDEVLAGRGDQLSAQVIAVRVLGRAEDFSTTEDSIVRVEMSKLRRSLARCYEEAAPGALGIELPRGKYAPLFTTVDSSPPRSRPSIPEIRTPETEIVAPASSREDGPVVAVLPFRAISLSSAGLRLSGPDDARGPGPNSARSMVLAQGLTDRVGALCAACPYVHLVSQASSIDAAAAHGARYVVDGSVRLIPGSMLVSVKLHDIARGVQIWGSTYERFGTEEQLFAAEESIARPIAVELLGIPLGVIHATESAERAQQPLRTAYEVALRYPRWFSTFDPLLQAELREASDRMLSLRPEDGALLAFASLFHALSAWTAAAERNNREVAVEHARRAVAVAPRLPGSHQALGLALVATGDARGALRAADTALHLGGPLSLTGFILALAGEWDRGAEVLGQHLPLVNRHIGSLRHPLALRAFRRGDFETALSEACAIATPNVAFEPLDRAASLARLGRLEEARRAAAQLVAILPETAHDPEGLAARVSCDAVLVKDLGSALRLAVKGAR